jgi:DNA-directed RNA polymerase subunit K/omega
MYVYFDIDGNIKSISPDPDAFSSANYSTAMFPLTEVEPFLTAKKSTFDYYISVVKKLLSVEYKLVRKITPRITQLRSLDSFLVELKQSVDEVVIAIENHIADKKIRITLSPDAKEVDENNVLEDFAKIPTSFLFFTKKNDPYFLMHTITFSPKELVDNGIITIPYDVNLEGLSVFTKKIINEYSYTERQ